MDFDLMSMFINFTRSFVGDKACVCMKMYRYTRLLSPRSGIKLKELHKYYKNIVAIIYDFNTLIQFQRETSANYLPVVFIVLFMIYLVVCFLFCFVLCFV